MTLKDVTDLRRVSLATASSQSQTPLTDVAWPTCIVWSQRLLYTGSGKEDDHAQPLRAAPCAGGTSTLSGSYQGTARVLPCLLESELLASS